jgi:hypothetical protein
LLLLLLQGLLQLLILLHQLLQQRLLLVLLLDSRLYAMQLGKGATAKATVLPCLRLQQWQRAAAA